MKEAKRIRKMEKAEQIYHGKPPEKLWVLIDLANSNPRCKNYLWWFESKKLALAHKRYHDSDADLAHLIGPYRFKLSPKDQ